MKKLLTGALSQGKKVHEENKEGVTSKRVVYISSTETDSSLNAPDGQRIPNQGGLTYGQCRGHRL